MSITDTFILIFPFSLPLRSMHFQNGTADTLFYVIQNCAEFKTKADFKMTIIHVL